MNTPIQEILIVIPPAIANLPGLTLVEKAALSHVARIPACSNASLARVLGMAVRGVESMLRRLRGRGFINQVGRGRARAHRLTFHVEHHNKCGISSVATSHSPKGTLPCAIESGKQVIPTGTVQRTAPSEVELVIMVLESCLRHGRFTDALRRLAQLEELAQTLELSDEARAKLRMTISTIQNRTLAFQFVSANAEQLAPQIEHLVSAVATATPATLARLRQRIDEQALLGDALQLLALPH